MVQSVAYLANKLAIPKNIRSEMKYRFFSKLIN